MNQFKNLKVWQMSVDLAVDIHTLTKTFPKEEKFDLVLQMNKAATSVPSNIAEGAGRNSNKEYVHFLGIALGSAFELDTQLIICERLRYMNTEQFTDLQNRTVHIQNMLHNLKQTLLKTA